MKGTTLAELFGGKGAEAVLLHLYHHGESYGRAVEADMGVSLQTVQSQLERFERAGALVSKMAGRTRLYTWNPKSPFANPLREIARIAYEAIPLKDRPALFPTRRRHRSPGKPVS